MGSDNSAFSMSIYRFAVVSMLPLYSVLAFVSFTCSFLVAIGDSEYEPGPFAPLGICHRRSTRKMAYINTVWTSTKKSNM